MGSVASRGNPGQLGGGDPPPFGGGDPPPFGGGDPPPFGGGDPPPFGGGDPPPFGGGDPPPFGGGDPPPIGGSGQTSPAYGAGAASSGVVAQKRLNFRIQEQQESEWCWAAVAASIEKYFDPKSD